MLYLLLPHTLAIHVEKGFKVVREMWSSGLSRRYFTGGVREWFRRRQLDFYTTDKGQGQVVQKIQV